MDPSYESPQRIEPTRLSPLSEEVTDLVTDLSVRASTLGQKLHPRTAANLSALVRLMNTYYSNLIEGHNTRPREIERALEGQFDKNPDRRNLQIEAAAHVRLQTKIDEMAARGTLPSPASQDFLKWLHLEFYQDAPPEFLKIGTGSREITMTPGQWRTRPEEDVEVGQHLPPSSHSVAAFMNYFESVYTKEMAGGRTGRTVAMAVAHHRFNYIHPFPDGNGRVSRLMSHAMAHAAQIGAHGLWSISRGLARGLESRKDYKRYMAHADQPRRGDLDGRGNLSQQALAEFVIWFLSVCIDQVTYMADLFDLEGLRVRLHKYVERSEKLAPQAAHLLEEALIRGEFERGEVGRITGLPARTARLVFSNLFATGLLASETPRGPVSLRFPADSLEVLFPKLFPEV